MKNSKDNSNLLNEDQAGLMANLTLQMEKFCQVKENFFASKFNLTPAEFRCLRYIKDHEIKNTKVLATQMNLTPGRITHLLNSLDKKGLIERKIDTSDRRVIQVSLTPSAHDFIHNVINEYTQLHEAILKYLPDSQRNEILDNMKYFFIALKEWAESIQKKID